MKKKIIFIILLILSGKITFGQDNKDFKQTIRGTVVDKVTQITLPGVNIVLQGTKPTIGTATDMNGDFKIENIDVGSHTLLIRYLGYEPKTVSIELTTGKEAVLNIELEEQAFTLDVVTVTANERKDETINKMATVSARSFTVKETERYAGSLGDPARMASNFAGVAMADDSRNDIIIRGNSPVGVLWRLDGVEIPNPNHFSANGTTGGPVSMLNNNLLSNSDFFTSAFPAQYGNAMSGVFDLRMRSGNNQKREYWGQIGFNGFEIGAEGPFKKRGQASYLINYRYSTLGLMAKLGFNSGTGDAVPYYQDFSFKVNLPRTKIGKISLFGIGGLSNIKIYDSLNPEGDNQQNYTDGGTDLDFYSNTGVLGLVNLKHLDKNTSIKTILSIQGATGGTKLDSLRYNTDGTLIPNSNYRYYGSASTEIKYSASVHFKKKINKRNNYTIGAYYDLYQVNFIDSVYTNTPFLNGFRKNIDVDGNISLIRGYAQWQHKYSNKLTFNSGLYSQYVWLNNEISFEPRFGVKYKLTKKQTISAGYGLHSQTQPRIYYFKQELQPDGTYKKTNKNMKLSKSHQLALSYDVLFAKDFRLKTELYYQYLYNIPVSTSTQQFSMLNAGTSFQGFEPGSDSLINVGSGKNYGVEFTLEKFLSNNLYFLTTASLFNSKYKGYDKIERNTAFNNNFILNVLGGYKLKVSKHGYLSTDLKLSYAGGKRYIPVDINASIAAGEAFYDWDNAYNNRFDNYFRTDVRISYKTDWKRVSQEWAIDLQNITNQKNIFSETYNPKTQEVEIKYQLGFYPAFLYRITF